MQNLSCRNVLNDNSNKVEQMAMCNPKKEFLCQFQASNIN